MAGETIEEQLLAWLVELDRLIAQLEANRGW